MKRRYLLGVALIGLALGLALFFLLNFGRKSSLGSGTKNLLNAKQFAIGCQLFAADHGGRFPVHLKELEPDYLPEGTMDALRCVIIADGKGTEHLVDWLYFGAGFNEQNRPRLLIASPQVTTRRGRSSRAFVEGDISGRYGDETDYQKLLAETVKQMRANEESQRAQKTSPVPQAK